MATTPQPGVEPDQIPDSLDACHRCALYRDATQAVLAPVRATRR